MAANPAPPPSLAMKPAASSASAGADRAISGAARRPREVCARHRSPRCMQLVRKLDWIRRALRLRRAPAWDSAADRRAKNRSSGEILQATECWLPTMPSVALAGATAGEPGVVVIAGTGSIAFGRNSAGPYCASRRLGLSFWRRRRRFLDRAPGFARRPAMGGGLGSAQHPCEPGYSTQPARRNMNDLLHRCYTPEFPRPRVAGLSVAGEPCRGSRRSSGSRNPGCGRPRTGVVGDGGARTDVPGTGAPALVSLLGRCIP